MTVEKKIKAAIAGVIMMLKQNDNISPKKQKRNHWSKFGRETIMRNRVMTQRRGNVFGAGRS
ncbi:MAG: hypothetical protein K8S23_03050 [Candidatus Cloacimonetes bacterium]|nr:hypothetical protein [Candidatus Cloacimonadota bacterium]